MGLWDDIKKKTEELVDDAGNSFDSIVDNMKETADSAATTIGEISNTVADKAGQVFDSVADSTSSMVDSLSSKSSEVMDDFLRLMATEFYDIINKFDFDGALEKLNEVQASGERDISPLIDFVNNLKAFAEEGKKKYGESN